MGVVAHALMPVILALGRLRLEDREFEASLGYIIRKKKKWLFQSCFWFWGNKLMFVIETLNQMP